MRPFRYYTVEYQGPAVTGIRAGTSIRRITVGAASEAQALFRAALKVVGSGFRIVGRAL